MAKKPSNSSRSTNSSSSSRARAIGIGRFIFCQGSGYTHEQVILEIQQGPKVRFTKCPIPDCRDKSFLSGPGWNRADIGMSREEARKANPNALIF